MKPIKTVIAICALPLTLLTGQALADDMGGMNMDMSQPLQVQQTENGGSYISGGVGDEEMAQIKSSRKDYNLHVLFTEKTGDFVSGVQVKISDSKGQAVLDTTTTGPYLYAKLPAGKYKINAMLDDKTQTRTVQVAGHGGGDTHITF